MRVSSWLGENSCHNVNIMRVNKPVKLLIAAICGLGVLLICLGFFGIYRTLNQVHPYTIEQVGVATDSSMVSTGTAEGNPEVNTRNTENTIVVDVGGAVIQPGVYELAVDSRLADLIEAAGGFSEAADKNYLNQNLNLAMMLGDTMKIYIPQSGEVLEGGKNAVAASGVSGGGISINNATEKELQTLSGIGAVRAQAIISGRPYSNVNELTERGILTEKIFTNIKEDITL